MKKRTVGMYAWRGARKNIFLRMFPAPVCSSLAAQISRPCGIDSLKVSKVKSLGAWGYVCGVTGCGAVLAKRADKLPNCWIACAASDFACWHAKSPGVSTPESAVAAAV